MKPKKLLALASLSAAVERLVYQTSGGSALFQELQLVAESQERQHRRTTSPYRGSVRDAVHYFTCKAVLEPFPPPKSWHDAATLRRDYALGQACRELALDKSRSGLAALENAWEELAIDYVRDIAGDR